MFMRTAIKQSEFDCLIIHVHKRKTEFSDQKSLIYELSFSKLQSYLFDASRRIQLSFFFNSVYVQKAATATEKIIAFWNAKQLSILD